MSKGELARATGLCPTTVRHYVGSLARTPCVKVLERGESGLLLEVRAPEEISKLEMMCGASVTQTQARARRARNHFRDPSVREMVCKRDKGRCFYCLRRLRAGVLELDHVVPLAHGGDNSAKNAVACCHECNCAKGEGTAEEFLRKLFRQGALSQTELTQRMGALKSFRGEAR